MCVYSMIYDHFKEKHPDPFKWTPNIYEDYNELVRKAREYDRIMKERDCAKPEAEEFERVLKERFEKLQNVSIVNKVS